MFPPEVKEQAMVACGRRCCLCHKFCGVGMECHHIVQSADGGQDTQENCIPLCFDCHAEVGHYNNEHPKGVRFTAVELQAHRDRWFSKVANGQSVQLSLDHIQQDQNLFKKVYVLLGGSRKMIHFNDHDYANYYPTEYDMRLIDLVHLKELPETEFFDFTMESVFSDLVKIIQDYQEAGMNRVWWNSTGLAGVPSEWANGQEESEKRFWEAVKVMNEKAQNIWEAFSQFVKEARRTLKIDPVEAWIKDASEKK